MPNESNDRIAPQVIEDKAPLFKRCHGFNGVINYVCQTPNSSDEPLTLGGWTRPRETGRKP